MYQPIILKYDLSDFEPDISRKTLDLHYNTLYLKYLNNLNRFLINNNFKFNYPIKELFNKISDFPISDRDDILYNAGGVINHELYFRMLTTNPPSDIPEPLKGALIEKYGSIDNFLLEFKTKAGLLGGSGYTFLVVTPLKELLIVNLPNQDSPYFYNLIPIMNIDVWEHAYYLDVYTEREKYVNNFFKYMDYNEVNKNYNEAISDINTKNNSNN